jgi:hypothetical protein
MTVSVNSVNVVGAWGRKTTERVIVVPIQIIHRHPSPIRSALIDLIRI